MNTPAPAALTRKDCLRIAVWLGLGLLLARGVFGAAWEEYTLLAPFMDMPCVPHGLEVDDAGVYPAFLWYGILLLFLMLMEGGLRLCAFCRQRGWCRAVFGCKVALVGSALLLLGLLPCIIIPCAHEMLEKDNGSWNITFSGHALGALTLWLYIAGSAVCCLCLRWGLLKEKDTEPEGAGSSLFRLAWLAFLLTVGVPCMLLMLFFALTLLGGWAMLEGGLAAAALLHSPAVLPPVYKWGYLLGSTLGTAGVVALLYSWRRCYGQRWLRVLLGIPVALVSLAAAATALVALVNALRLGLGFLSGGGFTPLYLAAVALHFTLFATLLPWLWWRK